MSDTEEKNAHLEMDEIQQDKLKDDSDERVTRDASRKKSKKKKRSASRESSMNEETDYTTDDAADGDGEKKKKKKSTRRKASRSRSRERIESPKEEKKEEKKSTTLSVDDLDQFLESETAEIAKIEQDMKKKEEEANEEKRKKEEEGKKNEKKVSYFQLFRFADWKDYLLMFIGCISAIGHGVLMPLFAIFFGDVINAFGDPTSIEKTVNGIVVDFLILAAAAAISSYLQVSCLMLSGTRQANKIRKAYFKSVLSQEVGWYDCNETGELTTHIGGDVMLIQEAISEKLGSFLQMYTMFITGFVVGFVQGWKLALVILSVVPLLAICGAIMGIFISNFTNQGSKAYAKAGGVAEEVISSIRTVAAFGGEDLEKKRYSQQLEVALKGGIKKGHAAGAGMGLTMFVMFCSYSLSFWYGSVLLDKGRMDAGSIITVFFSILIGAMSIGQASPSISAFASGSGAAVKIYEVINRKPTINPFSEEGESPSSVTGRIEFKDVHFTYPNRPQQKILNGLSFTLEPGKTLALVGQSGCGKSTSISLIERFYDPDQGSVTLDGKDLKNLNIKWLRKQIGIVSQEPILFAKSIKENISFGREGVTEKEIHQAARDANIHDFISKLPQGYDTLVGERGTQLSGGQKQRIAIARALVRNPKILLLDEATSALDNKSEKIVQDALDKARKGRTTVVIAHRLSTVRNADMICVVDKGVIVESGTHDELMAKPKSIYQDLVKLQEIAGQEKEGKKESEDAGEPDSIQTQNSTRESSATVAASFSKTVSNKNDTSRKDEADLKESDGPIPPEYTDSKIFLRSFKLNLPEFVYILIGTLAAMTNGAVFPVFSLVFSEVLSDLLTTTDPEERRKNINFWCVMFIVLASGTGLANYFQNAMFGISGEQLTNRVRQMFFGAIIRQEVAFFDDTKHSTGILATKLSNDATLVKGITGERIGLTLQLLSTIVIGLIIAFTSCWELALVVLGCVPLVGMGAAGQLKVMTGFNLKARKAYENSGGVASEAISNIRTVAGLGLEEKFIYFFDESLIEPERQGKKTSQIAGLGFAFGESMLFLIWALAFYFGGWLVAHGRCSFGEMMKAVSSVIFSAAMMGQLSSLMPDVSKATVAARGIFEIIDSVPKIDSASNEGTKLDTIKGEIEFRNVKFFYPSRPNIKILKGLSFKIKPGQTLALVGSSGCGKSTSVSILERFYDIEDGQILLDGVDMRSMNVKWLRRQIGIVGQEPILFATSILENIAYGKDGNATTEEVIDAAKKANAHKFISALSSGYQTDVGEKGSQLSGGQKQRVAIARALIRDPKILLLDEATSALDSESEKIVQHALDRARKGRTTIVIAHRLSTIQNADAIAVVDNGVVVEQGSHFELLEKKGHYYRLVNNMANPI